MNDPVYNKLIDLFRTEFAFWKYWDQWVYFCKQDNMEMADRMRKKWEAIK